MEVAGRTREKTEVEMGDRYALGTLPGSRVLTFDSHLVDPQLARYETPRRVVEWEKRRRGFR